MQEAEQLLLSKYLWDQDCCEHGPVLEKPDTKMGADTAWGAASLEQAVPIPVCLCLNPSAPQGFESGMADGGSSAAFFLA